MAGRLLRVAPMTRPERAMSFTNKRSARPRTRRSRPHYARSLAAGAVLAVVYAGSGTGCDGSVEEDGASGAGGAKGVGMGQGWKCWLEATGLSPRSSMPIGARQRR